MKTKLAYLQDKRQECLCVCMCVCLFRNVPGDDVLTDAGQDWGRGQQQQAQRALRMVTLWRSPEER